MDKLNLSAENRRTLTTISDKGDEDSNYLNKILVVVYGRKFLIAPNPDGVIKRLKDTDQFGIIRGMSFISSVHI